MARRILVSAILVLLVAALVPPSAQAGERSRYIVVLKSSVGDPGAVARQHARSNGARIGHVYTHAIKGYSASMSDVAAAKLANDDRVSYVEPDGVAHKVAVQEDPPSWGLDRIDEHARDDISSYNYDRTGTGVNAYIIDSGVTLHSDFTGRLGNGYDFVDKDSDASDCDGHGTHVAGTVGGTLYGVAKGVTLHGVRVLNCSGSGSWSNVIAGIDWVTANAQKPAVANMSLGGGFNSAVNDAVDGSSLSGVTYAVSAGNGNQGGKAQDACNYSPASAASALTVGATNNTDTKASWSNYGTCLDLFAPGVSITSTTRDGGTATWSGTSMSAPHVAGVAALYLEGAPSASAHQVATAINDQSTKDLVVDEGPGSPDRLLYSLLTSPAPAANVAPTANPDSASAEPGATVQIPVLANDTDANGDTLVVVRVTQPDEGGGSAQVSEGGTSVTYTAPATLGSYSFTYTASDGSLESSANVTVAVEEPPPPPEGATTATVSYATSGGKANDKHLRISVLLTDANTSAVPNTSVEVSITNGTTTWRGSGTTLGDGSVTWEIKNAPSGTYGTTVTMVAGVEWTGTTDDPGLTK